MTGEEEASMRDTASMGWRDVLWGGGGFDVSGDHPNKKGWEIFELGQKSFWAVPTAIDWNAEVKEDPDFAPHIAAMLGFLCPGEKAAVTGASYISNLVKSEEAKFYFTEQALEEAKHYDVMRRIIPKITGAPVEQPGLFTRLLYSFGVVARDDVAFMMGNINIIGEHLAHQILHRINHVATDPLIRQVVALVGRDESRHIAAGQRFFPEVHPEYKKHHRRILAKNLATTIILALASYELVNPMRALKIDLAEVMEKMYAHYADVTAGVGMRAFPDQATLDAVLTLVRNRTPVVIRAISSLTDDAGRFQSGRFVSLCAEAVKSPRALRSLLGLA
jgi:hypothetical protein